MYVRRPLTPSGFRNASVPWTIRAGLLVRFLNFMYDKLTKAHTSQSVGFILAMYEFKIAFQICRSMNMVEFLTCIFIQICILNPTSFSMQ
jgi:multisubunit Na+/H+ antiporter MnhG subunit